MAAQVPQPRNPRRMAWGEVPDAVVAAIGARAGSVVQSVEPAAFGFSPGFAGVAVLADGSRLFLKVMSGVRDPWSIDLNRREAEILSLLPRQVPAPRLLWTFEVDEWFVLATEVIDGDHPSPGDSRQMAAVWSAFAGLARVPAPADLPPFHEHFADLFTKWRTLAEAPDRDERLARLAADGEWVLANLESLMQWEAEGIEATKGDALVHGDLRADNMLLTPNGAVIVDWPWATRGAAWVDLAGYLPSHEMNGGSPCWETFHAHPLSTGVSARDERGIVTALAGFFAVTSTEPPTPALPGLRAFQHAQALPTLRWLRRL